MSDRRIRHAFAISMRQMSAPAVEAVIGLDSMRESIQDRRQEHVIKSTQVETRKEHHGQKWNRSSSVA